MINTKCAICRSEGNSKEVYKANVTPQSLTAETFSARRLPDRRHYRWARCNSCGLLRSDPVFEVDLVELYKENSFDYGKELGGLNKTYLGLAKIALGSNFRQKSVLEIGGGNGFFLEAVLQAGAGRVAGVEPSLDAVGKAASTVKSFMVVDVMRPGLFPPNSFDLVTMFHVMDHLPNPGETLSQLLEITKPGGHILVAVHNEKSLSSRVLRDKSPIIDVEHTYLYDRKTATKLLESIGITAVRTGAYWNHYSLRYVMHLLPISRQFRKKLLASPGLSRVLNLRVRLPLGNLWATGIKAIN